MFAVIPRRRTVWQVVEVLLPLGDPEREGITDYLVAMPSGRREVVPAGRCMPQRREER